MCLLEKLQDLFLLVYFEIGHDAFIPCFVNAITQNIIHISHEILGMYTIAPLLLCI